MTWREDLKPASFRGVQFGVQSVEVGGGRRSVVTPFPGRDAANVKDLGGTSRRYTFAAFVTGEDYHTRRDALVDALEASGPGTMVHPTYGAVRVQAGPYTTRESSDRGGVAEFVLEFVAVGITAAPRRTIGQAASVRAKAETARAAVAADLAAGWEVDALPGYVADAAEVSLSGRIDAARQAVASPAAAGLASLATVTAELNAIESNASSLIRTPATLAESYLAALLAIGDRDVLALLSAGVGFAPATPSPVEGEAQATANDEALQRIQFRGALVEYAALAADDDFETWDDAQAAADFIADGLGAAGEQAVGDVWEALSDLRSSSVADLLDRARELPRTRTATLQQWKPSFVLAHELYGDASRGDEIADRNAVAHPLFLLGDLQVLTA